MSRSPHVSRRLRYKKISYAEGAGNPAATTPWNVPPRYEPKPARPPARPQQQPANDAISEDLRTFRQQVRPGHAGGGPGTVRPNTPGERALLAQHAQRRGLKVRRSQYTYYDDATHTLYHPDPANHAAVGEAYVRMGGGRVKLARTPKPPRPTYSDLVTHAGAVFDNPMDDTAVRAFADHLQEVHGDNPAVQGFVKWTTGEGTIRDIIQHLRETAYRPYGPFNDRSNTAGIDDPDIEFRHRDTGNSYAKGQGESFWHRRENMRGKRGGPRTENAVARLDTRRVRGPRMTGADVAHAIYTEAGPESLINSVIGARYYHPDRTGPKTGGLDTVKMRRRVVRYAKADTRHDAHDLIRGFPIEFFLRHLANDASASSQLRDTAKHVLTTGDSSGLWGLHDLLQEHENGDGTTGHPALKAGYNLMSAADKLQLDKHVHDALHEEAERVRTAHRLPVSDEHADEARGIVAHNLAWDMDHGTRTGKDHQDKMKRIRSRVYSLSGERDHAKIDESIRRHAHRSYMEAMRRASPESPYNRERAINAPRPEHENEVATRYARVTLGPPTPKKTMGGGTVNHHDLLDESGKRVGGVRIVPNNEGKHLHVDWVDTPQGANALGAEAMASARTSLQTHYPDAEFVSGLRISGFRAKDKPLDNTTRTERTVVRLKPRTPAGGTPPTEAKMARRPRPRRFSLEAPIRTGKVPHSLCPTCGTANRAPSTETHVPSCRGCGIEYVARGTGGLWDQITEENYPPKPAYKINEGTGFPERMARRVVRYAKPNRSGFLDALRRLKSSNHTALTGAAADVANRMGVGPTKVLAALHDTPHGSVPGVAQAVYSDARPESVHALAAWVNGLLPNGPGYAVFHARDNGPDTLYRVRHEGSGMDVRVRLDRVGITSRVLVPHRKGFDVLVPDKGNKLAQNVAAYAQQHGLSVEASAGHFQTVGSSDQGQARARFRDKVVAGERRQQMSRRNPKRYAEVPTNPGEEWVKDFKVPVSYDSPNGDVGVAHYAPKRHAGSGRWVWSRLEHLGFVPDHETAKRMFPNVMHEDEFFNEHKTRGFGSGHADEETHNLTPEEIYLATDGREGTPPAPSEGTDWRPNETIPEDYYALSRRRRSPCRS